jgi:hypothetical protein
MRGLILGAIAATAAWSGCAADVGDRETRDHVEGHGKADAWWCAFNPFAWGCGDDEEAASTLRVSVEVCLDEVCTAVMAAACAEVQLVDVRGDGTGEVVARGRTNGHGNVSFEDVEPGEIAVRVNDLDGQVVVEKAITVGGAGDLERAYVYLPPGTRDLVRGCVHVRGSLAVVDCGGEPRPPSEEIRWDWVIRRSPPGDDGLDAAGTDYSSAPFAWDPGQNVWAFYDVPAGDHEIEAIRVDLPETYNLDLAEQLAWRHHEVAQTWDLSVDAASFGGEPLEVELAVREPWCD